MDTPGQPFSSEHELQRQGSAIAVMQAEVQGLKGVMAGFQATLTNINEKLSASRSINWQLLISVVALRFSLLLHFYQRAKGRAVRNSTGNSHRRGEPGNDGLPCGHPA